MSSYGNKLSLQLLICLSAALCFLLPGQVFAFDDEMSFGVEEVAPVHAGAAAKPKLSVVVVPTAELSMEQYQRVNSELRDTMSLVHGFEIHGSEAIMPALKERDPVNCSRVPLCLASVGRQGNMERLLIARVTTTDSGAYRFDLDLFDVEERLFLNYHSQSNLNGLDQVINAINPAVADVFNIRMPRQDNRIVEDDSSNIQKILAYSTAVLSAAALGTGIYYGMEVSAREQELMGMEKNESGAYRRLTQREAQRVVRDIEGDAMTANIFYGLAAGLGVASVLLFIIDSEPTEGRTDGRRYSQSDELQTPRWTILPTVSRDSVGFGAALRF